MSENRELIKHGQDDSDEDSDILHTTRKHEGDGHVGYASTSGTGKKVVKREVFTQPSVKLATVNASVKNLVSMIDTFDRPEGTYVEGTYIKSGTYIRGLEDAPGERLPRFGAGAEAGVGRAGAEFSVFEAEAKGPNASAGVEANVTGVGAMARAELASASAQAGPVGVKVGLGVDTGASVGADGVEVKFLGTGFSIGPKTSISLLGSEVSCSVM
ncbi:uncharacterized protein LOC122353873 [Puntigrus tetrazona]|uniref:uncharacterized protein LOC122348249 n=1 Tax=Puntigrus tetrazona TaxID=1606681 RepID=UPI001C8AE370|nr:uncharacterized protein LOC122348249 [Puntigrus tetrazona]XP_043107699.1 uncharacterized protein LOC122353873 [Puntigrus tetrazona]